jgi:hypothetical protein
MRTIVTAALQRQYSQTELTFWITYVHIQHGLAYVAVSCTLAGSEQLPKETSTFY